MPAQAFPQTQTYNMPFFFFIWSIQRLEAVRKDEGPYHFYKTNSSLCFPVVLLLAISVTNIATANGLATIKSKNQLLESQFDIEILILSALKTHSISVGCVDEGRFWYLLI